MEISAPSIVGAKPNFSVEVTSNGSQFAGWAGETAHRSGRVERVAGGHVSPRPQEATDSGINLALGVRADAVFSR